jgi:hypothetical protein
LNAANNTFAVAPIYKLVRPVASDKCQRVAPGCRERLSRYLMKMYIDGERDEYRLTVHGLSYLRNLDREIDS